MHLPSDAIHTESEFTGACMQHGANTVKILGYLIQEYKDQAFTADIKDGERNILAKKVINLEEVCTRIKSESFATAPNGSDY